MSEPSGNNAGRDALDYASRPNFRRIIVEDLPEGVRVTHPGSRKFVALFAAGLFSIGLSVLSHSWIESVTKDQVLRLALTVGGIVLGAAIFFATLWRARQATIVTLMPGKFVLDWPLPLWRETVEIPFDRFHGFKVWLMSKSTSIDFRTLGALSLESDRTYYLFKYTAVDELKWLAHYLVHRAQLAEEYVQNADRPLMD
jgi:hypothetical protein